MVFPGYLAMTGAEIARCSPLPPKIAWMACHFSPYHQGLSNIPAALPPGSILIADDSTPLSGHDPHRVAGELGNLVQKLQCSRVLLDFQRPGSAETARLVHVVVQSLSCPVGVSEPYARGLSCPVFLPPVPASCTLAEHLSGWSGRQIWLEAGLSSQVITVTEAGASTAPLTGPTPAEGFHDPELQCHYRIQTDDAAARFLLWRTVEDLATLVQDPRVTLSVGLYQEIG